jgi:hypothetical protein
MAVCTTRSSTASAHRRLPKSWRIRVGGTATGQACEWSRMLGPQPEVVFSLFPFEAPLSLWLLA